MWKMPFWKRRERFMRPRKGGDWTLGIRAPTICKEKKKQYNNKNKATLWEFGWDAKEEEEELQR
jgi:hypothetical protein